MYFLSVYISRAACWEALSLIWINVKALKIYMILYITWNVSLIFPDDEDGMSRVAGASIFTFQKVKRGHSMAQTGERLRVFYVMYTYISIALN